jgi:hypothetical protein
MAHANDPLVVQYQGFVTDLTTVEKRSIVGLTEIARDALRTYPQLAPSLASVIMTRILQVRCLNESHNVPVRVQALVLFTDQ